MEDTILVKVPKLYLSKNIFIDKKYFEEIDKKHDISNVSGRYKRVWERQEGKCYICHKKIDVEQEKTIIYKKGRKDKSINNIAYVHEFCKDSMIQYVQVEESNIKDINVKEVLKSINSKEKKTKKESKFLKLTEYFHNLRRNKVTLKFKDIEKILGFKLCESAYKYRTYFTNKAKGTISETWNNQGFKISKIDLDNQKISFERVKFNRTKIILPKFLYRTDLPMEAVQEIKNFFLHIKEKYRIE